MSCAPRHTTLLSALLVAVTMGGSACAPATATERAQTLVRRHQDEEAVVLLRQRLRGYPDDRPARRLLIALLGLTGDVPAARAEALELARRSAPDDPAAALDLGHALELAHRYDEALDSYDEAARVAPASAEGPREGGM
ncbi:MAG: tetratricopeptide repeat protein, partial [Myxococcota bacterium]|nr:tetratricopeptide repeat protein [Myxococcota bacterium]